MFHAGKFSVYQVVWFLFPMFYNNGWCRFKCDPRNVWHQLEFNLPQSTIDCLLSLFHLSSHTCGSRLNLGQYSNTCPLQGSTKASSQHLFYVLFSHKHYPDFLMILIRVKLNLRVYWKSLQKFRSRLDGDRTRLVSDLYPPRTFPSHSLHPVIPHLILIKTQSCLIKCQMDSKKLSLQNFSTVNEVWF